MMRTLVIILCLQLVTAEAMASKKKVYKYRKSQEHKFTGSELMGEGFDPSGSIMSEEHPQTFDYIFDKEVKVLRKVNKLSKYVGRSLWQKTNL